MFPYVALVWLVPGLAIVFADLALVRQIDWYLNENKGSRPGEHAQPVSSRMRNCEKSLAVPDHRCRRRTRGKEKCEKKLLALVLRLDVHGNLRPGS